VTDQIVYNIHRLSNQKYEDVYASTVKSRIARAE
jgi:1-acyl-sn-glycerol-3-phosphate acyltransferase